MDIEWDEIKAAANLEKHGVSFFEASTVFDDPLATTFDDHAHSFDEERFITIGYSRWNDLVFVSHVERQGKTRIISARYATRSERKQYERGDFEAR